MRFNRFVRKACFLILGMGACLPVMAADDDGLVKMVTYFPVPYAAYNAVFVQNKFDVGTTKNTFTLHLGDTACTDDGTPRPSLKATDAVLRKYGPSSNPSALSFGSDIYTPTATFGELKDDGNNTLQFNKLRVHTFNTNNSSTALKLIQGTNSINVDGKAYVFSNSAALPKCDSTVSWQELQLGNNAGDTHYFLVCGPLQACLGQDEEKRKACQNDGGNTAYVSGSWTSSPDCSCSCDVVANSEPDGAGHCKCKAGYQRTDDGICKELPCHISTHQDKYNACTNSGGTWTTDMSMTADKCCTCPDGYRVNSSGACEEIPCYVSTHQTKYNACTNSGGTWNANATSASSCCDCGDKTLQSDGTCKEIQYKWALTTTGQFLIPACRVDATHPMTAEDCYSGNCPNGEGTFTVPDDRRRCGYCNASTGGYHCVTVAGISIQEYAGSDFYYCNFVNQSCSRIPVE